MRALITGASPGIGGATCRRLVDIANLKGEKIKLAACEITETDAVKNRGLKSKRYP
jgi:NAD(P)-dependent dehydrogenase (short-subunit alcohol dehydrogenase family)